MRCAFATLLFVTLLCISHEAAALKISPFKASITPSTDKATQVFRIENNSNESAAIQVSVQTWAIAPNGEEINNDAEDDFSVFPAQMVLKPHESRAVRVQYLGEMPDAEKAYRVLAEQIPINLQDTQNAGSGVKFLLRFKAGLYVTPIGAKSHVVVSGVEKQENLVRITLNNKGTLHTLLREPVLRLETDAGETVTLDKDQIKPMDSANMHAGIARSFDIEVPSGLTSVRSAKLEYEPGF